MKQNAEFNKQNNIRRTGIEKLDNIIKAVNFIGGHGSLKQILSAYEHVTQAKNSDAIKDYIKRNLNSNCPDNSDYSGNPIFYKIQYQEERIWKIANEYLTRGNMPARKKLMDEQIALLSSNEKIVFNTINSLSAQKFTLQDLSQYKAAMAAVFPDIEDFDAFFKEGIKALRIKGLIELVDAKTNSYKKSFSIKIN